MFISAPTLDDLLHKVFQKLLKQGISIASNQGSSKELIGVMLKLQNPLARLSRTESKGKVFSGLGELFWYLSGTNDLAFISYYLDQYKKATDDGKTIFGGYGPRLFFNRRIDQVSNVLHLLAKPGDTRRAVIQLFNAEDLVEHHKDIPCTCTLQFLRRGGQLHMVTYMRSNDAFIGLPHDIFAFTMLQEMLARKLGIEIGTYSHAVGSLHLYDRNEVQARTYLEEGWPSTSFHLPMPSMPLGDPWLHIAELSKAEGAIRRGNEFDLKQCKLPAYWKDVIRLLKIFRLGKSKLKSEVQKISGIKKSMSSEVYDIYIDTYFSRRSSKSTRTATPEQMPFEEFLASDVTNP
jgi:thymidylate synthase